MNDPIIPDVDENGAQVRQLDQSQEFASTRSPDEAAGTMDYAKRAGLDFQVAEKMKPQYPWLAKNQTSWGNLVKDHPVLADHLADPGFASVAKDDVHNLSMMERLFGGWDDMAWASKLALEGDTRSQELAKIGRAQRYGKATPEMLKRADELDKEPPAPQMGFLPGIVPSVVGMLPGLARASGTAAAFAGGGALLGSAVPGVGTVGGALAMGGAGFVAGMAMDSASTEQGIAFRDYTKMGADPQTAGVAADIVALANGGLQAIPAEKVLNIVPGLKGLLVGQGTRDVMRKLIASNTGRAALTRFAGRVAESGLLMALIGSSQELIRETGAIASGADTQYHGGRIWDAGVGGAQQGLGFGIATKALPLRGDLVEAKAAENRSTLYKTLGQIATDSKLRERMPDAYKSYANAVIKKYGKVDEVKAPAEALANLFQKEGVTNEQLQEVMPEVAKQLRESKPTDEVVIPMADLATHVAGLKGFPELSSDLRVGDELTPREAKAVVAEAEKAQAAHEATKKEIDSGEATPARKVYDEVFSKLTEAGHAPEVAGPDATLWAAFAKARGERLGIDPYEYFSKRAVNIGAEFEDGPIELGQGPKDYGGTHRPPDPEHGAPLYDLTGGGKIYPDDVYGPDGARIYGHGDAALDVATMKEMQRIKGNPDAEVTIYRAVPKDAKDADIHTGDWITVNRKYAEEHGQRFEGGFKIVSKDVRARELFTDGNSIHEAGYWRGGAKPPASEAFNKWFKGSKIKDEEGNPLVVYHGTTQHDGFGGMPFKEFRTQPEYIEGDEGGGVENVSGMDPTAFLGAHFAKERSVAKQFARGIYRSKEMKEQKGHIFDVYLSIKNPAKMTETEMRNRIFQQDINSSLVEQYLDRGDGELDANFERYSNDPEFRQQVNEDILLNNALGYEGESDLSAFAQELADGFKRSLGKKVDGIIYKNEGEGGTSYIAFNSAQIKSIHNTGAWDPHNPNILEQQAGEGYRGKISFDAARSYLNITLTGKANLSTFLHESGHAFLEFMRADAANGTVDPDLAKVYEYLGVKPGEEPSVPQLETFARSFEAYLREGKAPSTGLREAFRTFGAWLKMIYKSLTGLGVNLNDDIRGVMDRMLATDSEIEEARENLGFEPMKKPKEMPPEEYATYKERFAKAVEDTRDRLQEQALRAFSRTVGEERSKVRSEVEEKLKTDRAQNAFEALATGKRLDGAEVPEEVRGQKISRAAIEDYPGFKETKKWTSITDAKGGGDPEVLAPYYGFTSGQEMLDALNARRPRSVEIKEETERRMREKYPDAEMGAMADQAVKSFHEEGSVEKVLWTEAAETAKYLSGLEEQHAQAQGGERDLRVQKAKIKEIASRRVESMTALEMQPGRFARAEEAAARESARAFRAGDFAKAHEEKLSQIANHELWKRVSAAKEETESIRDYLNKFNELPSRRKVGKAGQSYIEAIDKIITDIELKRVSNKEIARRASLEAYLKKMEDEDGAVLNIPDDLRSEASLKNYKTMTLEELRTVRDAVKNIESMARLKNRLFDGREYREWNATGVKAAEHVRANLGTPYAEKASDPQNPEWWDKKKTWLREAAAEKKKIEFVARELDGGQTAGFMHELLFQPFATAEARRHTLTEKITETLLKPLRELNIKERMALDRTVDFLGTPMRMRDVISVALNMGNEGNKRKLIEGYGYRGWTEEAVTKRLGELLTDKHLDLVQHFWDTIGQLWPDIKELSERTTGLSPPKVDPTSLVINGRELKGGYYPIVYDRSRDYKAEQIAQKKGDLWENNFLKPGVSKGFTEARTQFYAPLLLSLNVIPSHINEVVHYLTHYEATRAVDRLLNHKELRKAITEGLGRETYNLFRPWLQAIAHDGVVPGNLTLMDGILRHLRVGAAVTRLGFRVTNSIMQGFNLLSSVKELGGAIDGPKYLGIGIKRWMEDVDSFRDPFAGIYSKSPELAGKASKIEHEMVNNFDHFTSAFSEFGHLKNQLGHFAMSFMTLAWKTCDTITWYAAREKAMDENHPRPLEYADSVVRMSQMGEGIKDKAAIMRGGEGVKIFTNMYSWYSVIYNQLSETQPQSRTGWQKTGELASRWWWMVLAPSVAMGLARGKGPSKDKDNPASWLKYYGEEIALEAAKPWPVAGVAVDALLGEHEAKFAPWIATVLKGIKARGKAAEGEKLSDGEKKALVESTGITSHLPATALWNAYRYVSAVTDGKLEEPIRDLLFRAPGEWK